jgi:radial spoke head protein 1
VNGDKYEGDWQNNCKHGIGKMTYRKKKEEEDDKGAAYIERGEYHGFWENNRRHGEGVFTYPNGDVYSGWWRFGEKEGKGTYVFKETGMKMHGDWEHGEIKRGRWIYPNGLYFEGEFKNNKPFGEGTWYFKNGNKLHGWYEQKPKVGEEEEEAEEEEGVAKKPKFDLAWHSEANIAEAARMVNSVEQ